MNKIDLNLYSRQICTYGIDIMEKIINLKILVVGLRGLGIEISKNLVLAGPKQLTIYDKNLCAINDLSSNFYIEEFDISKKRRDIACLEKLSLLNPYVQVDICQNDNLLDIIKNYNFIIITEIQNYNFLFEINKYCRENHIGFIYTGIFGLSGFLFNDFGDKHIVYNQNGLDNFSYNINCNRELLNSRYDDQIAIFGQEIQKKLSNLNIFMIGAGALGCEYLKNFSLMGISTSQNQENKVTVTDNDNIELSNLSRQFLFRNSDIGNSKSMCACRESKKINKNFNCLDLNYLVNEDTINIFSDDFWEKQNIIITAVDNLQARKYIDKKCTFYSLALIDAGTQGTNASSDIFYPGKTICLNDLPEPTQTKIPLCTLKKFPTQIIHCIEWSKEIFKDLFEEGINELKICINNKENFISILKTKISNNELYLKLKKIKYFSIILENTNNKNIIEFAMFLFIYYFNLSINSLIKEYPLDKILDDGKLFWECGKKPPHALEINIQDSNTILYFKSFYHILSNIINYKEKIEEKEIINIINTLKKSDIKFNLDSIEKDKIEEILERLGNIREKINKLVPETFDKDNDNNYHVNFILSLSNLRAENYKINKSNYLKVKEISGNIIPAIASTTASITGIASLQIYTLLQTDNIKFMKCSAFNLGLSDFDIFSPEETRYITDKNKNDNSKAIKVIPDKYSVWDHIEIIGPNITIKELIKLFKLKYNIEIDFINSGNKTISSPLEDDEEEFSFTIEELYSKENKININNLKYIELKIVSIDKNYKYSIPVIKYVLKQDNKNNIENKEIIFFKKLK